MRTLAKIIITAMVVLLSAGCASTPSDPTLADTMRGYSEDAQRQADLRQELARRWERGNELERTGERRAARARDQIEEAEQEIANARQAINRGNAEVQEGRELKAESERQFRRNFPDLQLEPVEEDIGE